MATDPFDLLARAAAGKSDLRLEQAVVTAVAGKVATVAMRGGTVAGVECIGEPTVGARLWLLVDSGRVLGLATGGGSAPGVTDHGALTGLGDNDHPQYVLDTGDTMTGDLVINTGDTARVSMDAPSGSYAGPQMRTGGVARWWLYKDNVAESGSDTGSNLAMNRYSDTGASLGQVFSINRATGVFNFPLQPTVSAGVSEVDIAPASGWEHYGGALGNVKATRFGRIVALQGMFARTSALTATAGVAVNMGTIGAAALRPDVQVVGSGFASGPTNPQACRINVRDDGMIQYQSYASGSIPIGGQVAFSLSYRAV